MTKDDMRIKAIDTALEWSKQIITLSSGILVLSGTFIKDLFTGTISNIAFLLTSWGCFCACILFGLLFLGSLCSALSTQDPSNISIYSKPVQALGFLHFMSFFMALVFFALFAFGNLVSSRG